MIAPALATVAASGAAAPAAVVPAGAPAPAPLAAPAAPPAERQQVPRGPVSYRPPVDAPVTDGFRPPEHPFGPGNRGLEYATASGQAVRAAADGTVVFAGPVGGALHVTVAHADGVRTSYSFLTAIDVVLGQRVGQGDVLGDAGDRLHFGARIGGAYVDPARLFDATGGGWVELVPVEAPPGAGPDDEAVALAQIAREGGFTPPGGAEVLGWLREQASRALHSADTWAPTLRPLALALDVGERLLAPGPCSRAPAPEAPVRHQPRVAITVAGLGSSSTSGSIDELRTSDLGYQDDHVVRFSYAGGRVRGSGAGLDLPGTGSAYVSADTQGDLERAGRRLADLVEQVLTAEPTVTVDLFAHSQGGVVARLALLELAARGVDLDRLGLVATLGAPHRGASLATGVRDATISFGVNPAVELAEEALDTGIDPGSEAVRQLSETSEVVDRLRRQGVPEGVHLISIAARGDWVVTSPHTEVSGATNVIVPVVGWHAHGDLVSSDEATAELARALAGQPPGCEDVLDLLGDAVTGYGISTLEDRALGAALPTP